MKQYTIIMNEDDINRVNKLTRTPPEDFSIHDFCMYFDLIGDSRLIIFEKILQDYEKCFISVDSYPSDGNYNPNKIDYDTVTVYNMSVEYYNPEDEFLLELSV